MVKFRYSEKATKIWKKKSIGLLSNVKQKWEIFFKSFCLSQNIWTFNLKLVRLRTYAKKKKQRWTISSSTWYDLTRPDQSDWMILCSVMMSKFSFLPCRSADTLLYHSIQLPLEVNDRYNPLLGWYVLIVTGRA